MKGSNLKQSTNQGQNRQKGFCRNTSPDNPYTAQATKGICRRTVLNQQSISASPPAEPVIGESRTIFTSNLQILKEQAARLTSALQEIEAQIKNFEPR